MKEKLLENFNSLAADEQDILRALSIVFVPIGQTRLQELLKQSKSFSAGTIAKIDKAFRLKMLDLGLIDVTPAGWRCQRALSEKLIKQAFERQDTFDSVCEQAIHLGDHRHYMFVHLNAIKNLRIFLYQQNDEAFLTSFQQFIGQHEKYLKDTLKLLFFGDFDRIWFDSLALSIRLTVLCSYLKVINFEIVDSRLQFELLKQYFAQPGPEAFPFLPDYADFCLIRGDLQGLENLFDQHQNVKTWEKLAILRFLQNRNDEALVLFKDALQGIKKETRKRNVYFNDFAGLIYCLALFKQRTPHELALLKTQVKLAAKQGYWDNALVLAQERLQVGADVLNMKSKLQDQANFILFRRYSNDYDALLYVLLHHWLGALKEGIEHYPDIAEELAKACKSADAYGYPWFAALSSQFLLRFFKVEPEILEIAEKYQDSEFLQLIDLVPQLAGWQRALEALTHIGGQGGKTKTDEDVNHGLRLVWTVALNNQKLSFIPREQKRGKSGKWTKGREVSLYRLYDDLENFNYLSDQDRRICAHIKKGDISYGKHYSFQRNIIEIDDQAAFEMIGHPYVFWAGAASFNHSISLSEGQMQLLVAEHDDHIHIALVPFPDEHLSVLAEKTATGDVVLYKVGRQHLEVAEILGPNGLRAPKSAKQDVLNSISSIASVVTVQSDIEGHSSRAESVPADSRIHAHLQPLGDGLQVEIFVQPFKHGGPLYKPSTGGSQLFAEVEGQHVQTKRDFAQESRYLNEVLSHCPALYSSHELKWQLHDVETALETLLQLQALEDFAVLEWPKGKAIKISHENGLDSTQFSVRKQRDWFELSGGIQLDDDKVLEMQNLISLLSASPGRFLKLDDGQIIALTHELRQRLDDLQGLGEYSGDKLRFHPLSAPALDDLTEGMDIKAGKSWLEQIDKLNQSAHLEPMVPSTLQGELRPYQLDGYQWMARLAHLGAGACLADDMGLGKTIQALTVILNRAAAGPALIVAPTSVCNNWLEEAQRFAPTLNVGYLGTAKRQQMVDQAKAFDLVVCSYGLLQTQAEMLIAKQWHTIVLDEAQAIKNPQTQRSKAAMALQGNFKIITTGTPIENHLGELWSLFNFINPGLLGSIKKFNERFASKIENDKDYATQIRLKRLLQPFILRRLKYDVLSELPSRTEMTLHVELSEQERLFYEALRRSAKEKMDGELDIQAGAKHLMVLAEIMKLRRACCHPRLVMENSELGSSKLSAFEELLDELLENRHKALVFSQFVDHLEIIRQLLDEKGISYQYLDGSTSMQKRKTAVNAFQSGQGDLFLISLKAGGAGLNLTAADYVVHMDPWWNPAVEDQASDRAHRIGQQRPVTIYRLVAKNTIEDKIVELHRHKRDLANSLLEGGDISGKMSVEEMLELLRETDE